MKRVQTIAWMVTAAAGLGLIGWIFLCRNSDPVYEGKRVSVWFAQLDYAQPAGQREKAQEAFKKMGSLAVPFLINRLHADSDWAEKYRRFHSTLAQQWPIWITRVLPAPRRETAETIRSRAAWTLRLVGDAAKPAASDLAAAMVDESIFVSSSAGQTLQALGPSAREALPTVVEALRQTNEFIGNLAPAIVVGLARDSPEAVPMLTRLLVEQDTVKIRVLGLLPKLGKTALSTEREIKILVASTNASVRFAAIAALWDMFPDRHVELLVKFEEFAYSPDKSWRDQLGRRLLQMRPLTEHGVELLTMAVRDGSDDFSWSAFAILGDRGREAINAIPVLVAGLDAANPRVAAKAAAALGAIATADQETLGALERAKRHEYLMVRDAASEALENIRAKVD